MWHFRLMDYHLMNVIVRDSNRQAVLTTMWMRKLLLVIDEGCVHEVPSCQSSGQ